MLIIPDALLQCLHDKLGLNPASINSQSLLNGVVCRMRMRKVDDVNDYTSILQQENKEFSELVERVVVPETSFFRHPAAFVHLRHLAQDHKQKKGSLRILCMPSSTGEEPYSVAMCLLHDGWKAEDFTIDALDVSSRALARAKAGIYQKYSFRGDMTQQYMHFFSVSPEGYHLADEVKQCVRFHQRNILDDQYLLALGRYPIILCRNLLIYLHRDARCKVAQTLSTMLEKNGVLFAGNAENSSVWHDYFTSSRIPMAFAMRHADSLTTTRRFSIPPSLLKKAKAARLPAVATLTIPKKHQRPVTLATIKTTLDRGDMTAVIRQCNELLLLQPQNETCYYYLSLAYAAKGDAVTAIKKLRKSIYLRADYQEALQQLILLLENVGDIKSAKRMHQRLLTVREHARH